MNRTQILTAQIKRARERAVEMNVRIQRVEAGHYTAASQSTDDTVYHIRRTVTGSWGCECPGFTHHGNCKHVGAVMNREEQEPPVTQEMIETVADILSGKAVA